LFSKQENKDKQARYMKRYLKIKQFLSYKRYLKIKQFLSYELNLSVSHLFINGTSCKILMEHNL